MIIAILQNHCWNGMTDRVRKIIVSAIKLLCGVLALVLLKWIPRTSEGILLYVIGLAVVIALGIGLSSHEETGYWPKKPEK